VKTLSGVVLFYICSTIFVAGCASVPKESVELSSTVGRDLAVVHQAHRELAHTLFGRMRSDVNRFIDEVYAPYQIRNVMNRQHELANSSDPDDRKKSILLALAASVEPDAPSELQSSVLQGMSIMVRRLHEEIESMRRELLEPLELQEQEVLGSIDRAYQQLHYANSIVTGHLSSVRKVHETQSDLLESIGVERDLRSEVAGQLANTSSRIESLIQSGENINARVDSAEQTSKELMEAIQELGNNLRIN